MSNIEEDFLEEPDGSALYTFEEVRRITKSTREHCALIAEAEEDTPATMDSAYDRGYLAACDAIAARIRSGK